MQTMGDIIDMKQMHDWGCTIWLTAIKEANRPDAIIFLPSKHCRIFKASLAAHYTNVVLFLGGLAVFQRALLNSAAAVGSREYFQHRSAFAVF